MNCKIPWGLLFLSPALIHAQWECPTRLGASLKPIGSSNLMWADEVISSFGMMGQYKMANAMDFLGLDYSTNHHTLYLEGGIKSWVRLDSAEKHNQIVVPGLREFFYRHSGETGGITLGLQSAQGDDFFLLNERIVGANARVTLSNWNLNLVGGSVVKAFARNGSFCSVGYLYSVIPHREKAVLGRSLGETNFTLLTATYRPGSNDAAPVDEFATGDDAAKTRWFKVNSLGAVTYDEFGSWLNNPIVWKGLFTEEEFWETLKIKSELLYQDAAQNRALIYSVGSEVQISWAAGSATKAMVRYLGMVAVDSVARPFNSLSNVFAGEILRLDAMDIPFLQAGIKQSFPNSKFSFKVQMAQQIGQLHLTDLEIQQGRDGKRMREYDVSLSKTFGEHFLLNLTGGFVDYYFLKLQTDPEPADYYTGNAERFGKAEIRVTF